MTQSANISHALRGVKSEQLVLDRSVGEAKLSPSGQAKSNAILSSIRGINRDFPLQADLPCDDH